MTEGFAILMMQVDSQIAAAKLKPAPGQDRRKQQIALPEGMENRRKLKDRRKTRLATTEKELE